MNITSQMVKDLRDKTAAGMMDCKKALTETNGDMEKAVDLLRQKGLAVAAKKSRTGDERGRHRDVYPRRRKARGHDRAWL